MAILDTFDDKDLINLLHQEVGDLPLSKGARRRLEWFRYMVESGESVEEAARHLGVSPSTLYRWIARFDPKDLQSLEEGSRRPLHIRQSDVEEWVIALIQKYRTQFPTMGKGKIRQKLEAEHHIRISSSTIGRVITHYRLFFADTITHRAKRTISGGGIPEQPSLPFAA